MSRLIRWRDAGARIVVLWYDDAAGVTRTTEVDGVTLERLDGEPLATEVAQRLLADQDRHAFYQGVAC